VEDEVEDDPFGRGFEDEESDGEIDGGVTTLQSKEDEEMADGTSDSDFSEEDDEAPRIRVNGVAASGNSKEMMKEMQKDQKRVSTSLAQTTKDEAQKGQAVKKQKAAFDSLLNTRIKLQKTLVGVNTIVGLSTEELVAQCSEAKDTIEKAEIAAFRLWSSLNEMREELRVTRTGEKRKRSAFTETTSTIDLWEHMQTQEQAALSHRNTTLERWSAKAKSSTTRADRGVMDRGANEPTIVDALQEILSGRERLLKRAHTPRSCAPLQLSNKIASDSKIYDDADFYGLLLKELLEQKSADSVAATIIDLSSSLRREAKTKKNVDTKASKGRKLRYTVHEKLQNFMAPEHRGSWSERQAEELFGSLFGRRTGLGEGIEEDEVEDVDVDGGAIEEKEEDDDEEEEEEEGLMLFRT
jgi:protein AATF/BFR2